MRALGGVAVLLLLLAGCSAGNGETDRIADTVATAVEYPRQATADGYLRAVLATAAARDGRLTVISAERLGTGTDTVTTDAYAHFQWWIHIDGTESGFSSTDPVDACYDVTFDYYGAHHGPGRIDCPAERTAVTAIPGTEPTPAIPPNQDNPFAPTN